MSVNEKIEARACPFCGSTELSTNEWYIIDDEVDAIECDKCFAGAPLSTWNKRVNDEKQTD